MSRRTAYWVSDIEEFDEMVGILEANWSQLGGVKWDTSRGGIEGSFADMAVHLPRHRWQISGASGERQHWKQIKIELRKNLVNLWLNHTQGTVALVVSGGGDVKEIVFVKDGSEYKRRKGNKDPMPDVALVADQQSYAVLRVLRKIDTITTAMWYRPLMAPLDLELFIEKKIKGAIKKRPEGKVNV